MPEHPIVNGRPVLTPLVISDHEFSLRETAAILRLLISLRDNGPKTIDLRTASPAVRDKVFLLLSALLATQIAFAAYIGPHEGDDPEEIKQGPFEVFLLPKGMELLAADGL